MAPWHVIPDRRVMYVLKGPDLQRDPSTNVPCSCAVSTFLWPVIGAGHASKRAGDLSVVYGLLAAPYLIYGRRSLRNCFHVGERSITYAKASSQTTRWPSSTRRTYAGSPAADRV